MAVSRATSFTTTGTNPYTGVLRVGSIVITRNPAVTNAQYFALWNSAAPVVGTDAPDYSIIIPAHTLGLPTRQRLKMVLPNGGHRCSTALTYTVTTTFNGATASTTDAPLAVEVYYEIGG